MKLAVETGPLLAFFVAYSLYDIMTATAVFMGLVAVALVVSVALERRLPVMPLVSAVVVMVFGGLTLWLDDATFIKMKPTIINLLFAGLLLGGLATGRALLKPLFGAVFRLDDVGWRKLSLRWSLFFLAVAGLNEIVWRTMSTDTWVAFKVFGILPLTFAFALAQTSLIHRHAPADEAAE